MFDTYLFLRKARMKKKFNLYKQAFMLTFDFASIFYVSLLIGYFIYAIISEGDLLSSVRGNITQFLPDNIKILMPLLLYFFLIQLMKGIKASGVVFSESDYKLLTLPYQSKKLWLILLTERLFSSLIRYSLIGIVIYFLTLIELEVIIYLICYLLIINGLSAVIEWKMFSLHLIKKLMIIFIAWCFIIGLSFLPIEISLVVLISVLLGINYPLYQRLYNNINYEAVVMAGNFKTWNIPFVSYMSKTKVVKKERQSVLTKLNFFKKPLNYQTNAVNRRMLYLYLENNMKSVFQVLGALIILIVVAYFKITEFYYFIIGLSIIIYSSIGNLFFEGFWQTKLIDILPVRFNDYKIIYIKGLSLLNIPIFITYGSLLVYSDGLIGVLQLILFVLITYILLTMSLEKMINNMKQKLFNYHLELIITYLILVLIPFIKYNFLAGYIIVILGIFLLFRYFIKKRVR